jgi:cyclophilin family peptidyl-prolyl cis-trans isomerase
VPYQTGSIGVALAGRDTGVSQFFVSHVATPHLDGKYALLGRATGPWDALIDGDVIKKARLLE